MEENQIEELVTSENQDLIKENADSKVLNQVETHSDEEASVEENHASETQETESDGSSVPEKKMSRLQILFSNLSYRLSYTPALGFVSVMSVISFLGMLFFIYERNLFIEKPDVANSCIVFIVFFAIATILFFSLFISSVILNAIRRKQGKR